MKYPMSPHKNEPQFKKKKFYPLNWENDENGNRICPNRYVFNKYARETYQEIREYLSIKQKYTSEKSYERYPFMEECCKNKRYQKILKRYVMLEEYYMIVDWNLSAEHGKELKKQRRIQAEGALG